ncbi:5'-3' exoribonuclease 1 [Auxenochlorella protothecoides]|uniref:5'-3' exoribonuclease 1 n=1 Tax=Auxenochlorella protothecoides TaxID=3075 RepID=A0A087SM89_AUXPR|nr:5'-3' exoribonuclease 1 [Auxenochlorella protothecoides]KFM26843.1 5'-3' exoribonuclease 1 [Auxenochlorella protothecoides]
MGIPGFNSWVRKEYPEAFVPFERGRRVDHLYVDLASTLHTVLRKSRTPAQLHRRLHSRLDNYLARLRPCKRVVLALDGPGPLAKLLEQRRRRSKMKVAPEVPEAGEPGSEASLSPLALTAGTPFMLSVHASLLIYIARRLANPRNRGLVFEFSDSTVQGEGELKLLAKLQDQGGGRGAPTPGDTHVILGGDSDLYLIALVAPRPSVFIAADADIPHLGAPADQLTVFSRAALANVWGPHADVARLGLDLCLLAVLTSGNDYLPAIQASLGWGLVLKGGDRPGLWDLLLDLRRRRSAVGPCHLARRGRSGALTLDRATLAALLWRSYQQRRYIAGLEWVINMYARGRVQDYRFTYDLAAPTILGLVASLAHGQAAVEDGEEGAEEGEGAERGMAGGESCGPEGAQPALGAGRLARNGLKRDQAAARPNGAARQPGGADAELDEKAHGSRNNRPPAMDMESAVAPRTPPPAKSPAAPSKRPRDEDLAPALPLPPPPASPQSPSMQPLIPAACALATLPLSGRQFAASALQHLMDDGQGAALRHVYALCPTCQRIGAEIAAANKELARVRLAATQPVTAARADGQPPAAHVLLAEEAYRACKVAEAEALAALTALSQAQVAHMEEAHPFQPFPVDDVEAAVAGVDVRQYPSAERPLAGFGRDVQIW